MWLIVIFAITIQLGALSTSVSGQYCYTHSSSVWDGQAYDRTGTCRGGFYASYAYDGRTINRGGGGRRCNGFFHSSYEPYPWMAVCSRLNSVALKSVSYYGRSDAAQSGIRGTTVEIRTKATAPFTRGQRITTGDVCNTFRIQGGQSEKQTVTCTTPPTLDYTDYVTLQTLASYNTFLMVAEIVLNT